MKRLVTMLAVLALAACGGSPLYSGGGGAGAQAGGAKDIGLARAKIAQGQVPNAQDFPVEGLYAEHDLPLDGAPCDSVLCLRLGEGLAPRVGATEPSGFIQVGLSSNVDLNSFHRAPLNLAVVIDHSGSMAGDKMDAVKQAVHKLVDQLDGNDVLTVIEFDNSVNVLLGPEPVTDRAKFHTQVSRIEAAGGTCIECGIKVGYEKVRQNLGEGRSARVMLLTDAQPNIGGTEADDFLPLVQAGATQGIGLTAFGVGLDFGQTLATAITAERGANYVYLEDADKIRTAFDQDFDFLVTPIAYDLTLTVTPADGVQLEGIYGIPGQEPDAQSASMTVKTVFLSRSKGAITARLTGVAPGAKLADVHLGWTPIGEPPHSVDLSAMAPTEPAPAFTQVSTRKAFALTEMALGARDACAAWYGGDKAEARAKVTALADFVGTEAKELGDTGLATEATLLTDLGTIMNAN